MGEKITLKVEPRNIHGKKVRQLRQQGLTPGVVYGADMEPIDIQAEAGEVRRVVQAAGKHAPVQLMGSKRRIAMIKSVDFDPTRRGIIRHVAFHAVKANELVTAEVPIHLIGEGESPAERGGLVVLQALEKIEVKALPMDLPEALELSIMSLTEAGDRVTIGDITLPQGVELVEHDDGRVDEELEEGEEKPSVTDLVVANVYEPSALQAQNEAAAGEADSAEADNTEVTGEEAAANPEAK